MTRTKVYLMLQSLLLIALTVWMIAGVQALFREGIVLKQADPLAWIYTREKVTERLASIAPVFLIAMGTTMAGLVLGIRDKKQDQPVKAVRAELELLRSRVRTPSEEMKKESRKQRNLAVAGGAAFGMCMIPVMIYLLQTNHFPVDQLEKMFRDLLWGIVPWTVLGLAALLVTGLLKDRSARAEIRAAKEQIAKESAEYAAPEANAAREERMVRAVRAALLILAAVLIVAGILNGGIRDVLVKAINLCTECVGLG